MKTRKVGFGDQQESADSIVWSGKIAGDGCQQGLPLFVAVKVITRKVVQPKVCLRQRLPGL